MSILASHRASLLLCSAALATALAPGHAAADPKATTQACLGDLTAYLTCPTGAKVSGTECRQREAHGGTGAGEHWSGSKRQGPALFLRGDERAVNAQSLVNFAAYYINHKKNGRVFHFDKQGNLTSWNNVIDDQWYGLAVTCLPDGRVSYLATHAGNKTVGISRSWRAKDGELSYAIEYDAQGKVVRHLQPTPELARRPDELCRPARCEITAKPDMSLAPAGVSLPAPGKP